MSRAIILPTPADPFLVHYWYKNFLTWRNQIDMLYVVLNSPSEESRTYLTELLETDEKVTVLNFETMIDHGNAINEALKLVKEEYVGLIEDDAFVINPKAIGNAFERLESKHYDIQIVGSKRGSCSQEILDKAKNVWGLDYGGYGDHGCNFWPSFFFTRTQTLKDTDRNFNARRWEAGESLYNLGFADDVCYGDTFVNTSLQLQSRFKQDQIVYVDQNHANPEDIKHYEDKKYIFKHPIDWIHIGSLSSGFHGLLRNQHGRALALRKYQGNEDHNLPNAPTTEMEKYEYERRVQIWLTAYENRQQDALEDLAQDYWYALNNIIMQFKLSMKRIRRRQRIYKDAFNI